MRAISIAAIVTALIATAPISAAADQIITESFTLTIPNSPVPNDDQPLAEFDSSPFPLFAPSIGNLESVNIALSGAVQVASLLTNPNIAIIFQGPGLALIHGDTPLITQPGTTNLNFSGPDKTSSYIGTGNGIAFVVLGSADSTPNASLIESNGPLNGTVTYTYTLPTLAVPEAPTWATMFIGFASLAFAGRRAIRKAAIRV
jgi:hypothetical protein